MTSDNGSTWRRSDLHVHSPASVLYHEFEGATETEQWHRYLERLSELEGIGGLGITDYFSINGYRRVAEAKANGRLPNIPFVFPNIELRITPVTEDAKAINIHVLASPAIADELDPMLLAGLEFEYDGNTYRCNRTDLISLGRAFSKNPLMDELSAQRAGRTNSRPARARSRSSCEKTRNSAITALSSSLIGAVIAIPVFNKTAFRQHDKRSTA